MSYEPTPADKFTFGLWTVGNRGRDPFGDVVRPPLDPVATVQRLADIGAYGRELPRQRPGARSTPRRPNAIASSRDFRKALDDTGLKVPMATTNLFTDPVFKDGAFTSHDPRVRAYALQKTMRAIDLGVELGAKTYVFWGGREGAEVDAAKDAIEAHQAIPRGASTFSASTRATRDTTSGSRSKPSRTSRAATSTSRRRPRISAFIATLDHPEMVGVNPEVAHEHMIGLNFYHVVAQAIEAGKLFHIDLNDQKSGPVRSGSAIRIRVDQDAVLRRQAARGVRLRRPTPFRRACATGPRDADGVWDFARGCMRTYLILKEKARQFREDRDIQALLAEIRGDAADVSTFATFSSGVTAASKPNGSKRARSIARRSRRRPLPYERLISCVVELLLGSPGRCSATPPFSNAA